MNLKCLMRTQVIWTIVNYVKVVFLKNFRREIQIMFEL